MSRSRAPPEIWRIHDTFSNNELSSIVRGQHTIPGVLPSLFSPNHERKV